MNRVNLSQTQHNGCWVDKTVTDLQTYQFDSLVGKQGLGLKSFKTQRSSPNYSSLVSLVGEGGRVRAPTQYIRWREIDHNWLLPLRQVYCLLYKVHRLNFQQNHFLFLVILVIFSFRPCSSPVLSQQKPAVVSPEDHSLVPRRAGLAQWLVGRGWHKNNKLVLQKYHMVC